MNPSLYVHVPFCTSKCAYCDFASWAGRDDGESAWLGRIVKELELRGRQASGEISSVFLGGGTPSALSTESLERLCLAIGGNFTLSEGAEWSMEANPISLTAKKLECVRQAGVNRISLGVQSFDPDLLALMGRTHDSKQAELALDLLSKSGLRWSADLIFALPGQSLGQFLSSLDRLLSWDPSHVSFYGLTFEPGTAFLESLRQGRLQEPDEDLYASMYRHGVERLESTGILRYEVSNFARPGHECRHNQAYWDTRSSWLCAGNAAHGYVPHVRTNSPRDLDAWSAWADRGFPESEREREELSLEERWTEEWFLGLRRREGVDMPRLEREYGHSARAELVERRIRSGHVEKVGDRIVLTDDGWLLLDAITAELSG